MSLPRIVVEPYDIFMDFPLDNSDLKLKNADVSKIVQIYNLLLGSNVLQILFSRIFNV